MAATPHSKPSSLVGEFGGGKKGSQQPIRISSRPFSQSSRGLLDGAGILNVGRLVVVAFVVKAVVLNS
ncbi:hypothetical protein chiPu_0005591 [Chiloscyllium punctatum]|uniref:Uncharacterized protein n=1 Tax=Chiloscyllium punctatum TaxID=137246 RepID=A0A401S9U2_CHIPU|nr:hypothetical protein [Chiloscyllium punctatum]